MDDGEFSITDLNGKFGVYKLNNDGEKIKKKSGKEIDIEENGIFYIGNLKCIILSKQIAVFFL